MYMEEAGGGGGGCFDPNTIDEGVVDTGFIQAVPLMAGSTTNSHSSSFEDNNFKLSMEDQQQQHQLKEDHAMEIHLQQQQQQQLGFDSNNSLLIQQDPSSFSTHHQLMQLSYSNIWDSNIQDMQQLLLHHQNSNNTSANNTNSHSNPFHSTTPPDLLNLFHYPSSSISFAESLQNQIPAGATDAASSALYHLNQLPQEPPLFRGMFQPTHHAYSVPSTLFGGGGGGIGDFDHREGLYQDGGDADEILEFSGDMACIAGKSTRKGNRGKMSTKHFATERERRVNLNDRFKALRNLIPSPTKNDRASIVGDAIEYIKELRRTVNELQSLVEKKRWGRERGKRHKTDQEEGNGEVESSNMKHDPDHLQSYNNGTLRSSWLQRKSKDIEVDVRIIDDEVTIKLVHRKNNCLKFVSRLLDELQLDLHHVAGGHIGDYYSFMFNTKIYEGSCVYASAIANKMIELIGERQYASSLPANCY